MDKNKLTIKGGNAEQIIIGALSQIKNICLPIDITKATVELTSVITSIIKSNQDADCAGWSRLNCNATEKTTPCDSMC